MTQQDFTSLCKNYGFARTAPNIYARCIGDGVLQTIDTRSKDYMNPDSPEYSEASRKSKCIQIGISSLYAKWDESCFTPEGYANQFYTPSSFIGKKHSIQTFYGFDDHCRIMQEKGFPYLDSIVTQDAILKTKLELDNLLCSRKWIHALWVAAPLMACERWDEAMYEVCRYYTHTRETFHSNFDSLKQAGRIDEYFQEERKMKAKLETAQFLWRSLLVNDKEKILGFLQDNLLQNTIYAQKYGIPFVNQQL